MMKNEKIEKGQCLQDHLLRQYLIMLVYSTKSSVCMSQLFLTLFSREATLELVLSFKGVVILNLGCGYTKKGVVILRVVWLY